jgi:hypothetical protein
MQLMPFFLFHYEIKGTLCVTFNVLGHYTLNFLKTEGSCRSSAETADIDTFIHGMIFFHGDRRADSQFCGVLAVRFAAAVHLFPAILSVIGIYP